MRRTLLDHYTGREVTGFAPELNPDLRLQISDLSPWTSDFGGESDLTEVRRPMSKVCLAIFVSNPTGVGYSLAG